LNYVVGHHFNPIKIKNHFIANTEVVLTWKVLEFVKGKPKVTNPAIMGNPINMYAVKGSKQQSIVLLKKPKLN